MQDTTKCKVHTPLLKATLHNRQVDGGLSFIMGNYLNLLGKKFGRLTVLSFSHKKGSSNFWLCQCDCGNKKIAKATALNKNKCISCGCYIIECSKKRKTTHGKTKTRLFRIWGGIKKGCYNPNDKAYKNYGGRGILMDDNWEKDFMSFYNWAYENGYEDNLTIERIDNDKNYCPENCKWIPLEEQPKNRRYNKKIMYKGEEMTLSEFCRRYNVSYGFAQYRICKGWDLEKIINTKKIDMVKDTYFYKGKQMTFDEMSKINGINKGTIKSRVYSGWDIERAVEQPVQIHKKRRKENETT